ncbi:hypothetical protein E2562_029199 [Oryza meyeriana var. granulata]|uniref:Uncharacterized protein n=1 Tax=Oryza meyeriana var. granulata TaxID=110450 RepID=A0A6G1E3J3_9ORYZ|nr:hypothetical protein E2562_029199 [Oryza meyeriana var. granulata]
MSYLYNFLKPHLQIINRHKCRMAKCRNHGSEEEYSQVDPDGVDKVDSSHSRPQARPSTHQLI